jgi:hypothetical protein
MNDLYFSNNPLDVVIEAIRKLYPQAQAVIQLSSMFKNESFTVKMDGKLPMIMIQDNLEIWDMVKNIAHEVAHVIVGFDEDHGPKWEITYRRIQEKYVEIMEHRKENIKSYYETEFPKVH